MAVIGRPSKRSSVMAAIGRPPKRARVTAEPRPLDLRAFPAGGEGLLPAGRGEGAFSDRVRWFLTRCAVLAGGAWRVVFRDGEDGGTVAMEVVEEDVTRVEAARVYCEHCTVAGWSRHPVCGKRYHFIIRNEHGTHDCKTCRHCGLMVQLFETGCPSCKHGLSYDDPEEWDFMQLDNPRHLLHGIVHENGFGHLVRINGRDGGSSLFTGYQLMDFWDRLCRYLRVRKVSLMDVSKKYGTEYRVLHAIATGCSWYSQWGFKLSKGSFGITPDEYYKAIDSLSSTPLSHFFPHSRSPRNQLQDTITFYQSLSNRPLTTIRELFIYVLGLASSKSMHIQVGTMHKKEQSYAHLPETWPDEEIKRAMDIALKVLRAVDRTRWVAMRTLKAAISHPVGSQQLVDYCLKTLGTRKIDGMVVGVRCNNETNTIEYRLTNETISMPNTYLPTRDHLLRDIKFLYDMLLYPHTMHPYKPENNHEHAKRSAMILLDCKQFTKHYDLEEDFLPQNPSMLHIWCQVELLDQVGDPPCIPPELLTLPQTATVADLKAEATKTFHDIYLMLQTFVANQLLDCGTASEVTQVKLLFGANGTVRLQGRCVGGERRVGIYRMERGVDRWTVNCSCGAKDDDGERMLSCDSCHVWQHTRCAGISDFDQVPKRYVCKTCKSLHKPKSSGPRATFSIGPNKRCKLTQVPLAM
ncbi:PHD finger protein At1g33420-like [Phragmites australis]|uniref:PHD finger protein At1g33420-like n=1 Tax=Phragmites australis TaxID=29695 RepID=UPI002D7879F0|nr:PHD finger protein At1g33420-like [Phragmites australis]